MFYLVKLDCHYEIFEPASIINPNAKILGSFLIQSKEKREKRIKHLEIQLLESFKKFSGISPGIWGSWDRKTNVLDSWIIEEQIKIKAGEFKKFNFKVKLPNTWEPKKGQNLQDWHLSLSFVVKIGSKSLSLAQCVLPVYKSSRPPSYTLPLSDNTTYEMEIPKKQNTKGEYIETEMKFCSFCSEKIRKQAIYCEFCGTRQ